MKKIVNNIFIILLLLTCVCIFSSLLILPKTVQAASIEGISGNKFILTGYDGKSPKHFFTDANDQSTLVNCSAESRGEEYYSIVAKKGKNSSGWGDFLPSVDMLPFIENGLLYAQATANLTMKNMQATIKISSGNETKEIKTSSSGEVKTPLLLIKSAESTIKFSFETFSLNGNSSFVMNQPTIHLYTSINSVTLDNTDQVVSCGQIVKVNAYNDVTKLSGASGNFMSLSKINHEIEYVFDSGKNYVEVVGSNLIISQNAPNGTKIQFRVFCNKNSYSTEKIYSTNFVTLTVDSKNVNVKVRTDFACAATFPEEGNYIPGKSLTITANPNPDFEFLGWYVDGEFKTKKNKLRITATFGQDIYAKFVKNISVQKINILSRVYDGTTAIKDGQIEYVFNGLESGHEISVQGVSFSYSDANAGKNKYVHANFQELELVGKDKDLYKLKSQILPDTYGDISKREVKVSPKTAIKEYGYNDPEIQFTTSNLVEGDYILGNLYREGGEAIGKYKILIGDLNEKNLNYAVTLENNDAVFEITKRTLMLENVSVEEKIYDGTTDAKIKANLKNIYNSEDVSCKIFGKFVSKDAGSDKQVTITEVQLMGKDKDHYSVEKYSQTLYGEIKPKHISVIALDCSYVYGDELNLPYQAKGIIDNDKLDGCLQIADSHVGLHEITIGTLKSKNYIIDSFVGATCKITKRTIFVEAENVVKNYGDEDPNLTYKVKNMVVGDTLWGNLLRDSGETVGKYLIKIGDLNNENYEINFTGNYFEIRPREIEVVTEFLDKVYDGTTLVEHNTTFNNNIKNDKFNIEIKASLSSKNCGIVDVNVLENNVTANENYSFVYKYSNLQIEIRKREVVVFVDSLCKEYGQEDPVFTYSAKNLVENEKLNLKIERKRGETVGYYSYILENAETNWNYDVSLIEGFFEIKPKQFNLKIENISKFYGENDPVISYEIADSFCFSDTQKVINGSITRQAGENVGVYELDLSTLSTNENYRFVNKENASFIINKRPVTVTAKNSSKTYGEEDPIFDYSVSNDLENDRLSVKIIRENGEDVGEYKLLCANYNDARYAIDFVEAKLTILPYAITIKADEKNKIYGEKDPEFTVTITKGFLKNNDRLSDIVFGDLTRELGEDVGQYIIKSGDLSLGKNYTITFVEGKLNILQRHVTISALETSKIYGENDPKILYTINGDGLAFNDSVTGNLSRVSGEDAGVYKILQGDIQINENYHFDFVENNFIIRKRVIQILPITLSKQYGEADTEIKYEIQGELIDGDILQGNLYRDKDKNAIESTGKYEIHSNLQHKNYEIILAKTYFTILPREIVVTSNNYQIYYGEEDPKLEYKIISGTLLDGDDFSGSLTRAKGNSAGVYNINCNLTLNRNYSIKYIQSTLTIMPLEITIQSSNYTKIYGQKDPTFTYEIVDGELINGDKLYGFITRKQGEDVGVYDLEKAVYNTNYNITLLPAKLEIMKKDVYMICSIYNKVYDGTTKAKLKNPYISGTIDDVYLDYDVDNCAEFACSQVGTHIAVSVHDIDMVGEKSKNYNLILPKELYADITLAEIALEQGKLSTTEAILYQDFSLKINAEDIKENVKVQNYRLIKKVDIWLEKDSQKIYAEGLFTITLSVSKDIFKKNNIFIYQKADDGSLIRLNAKKGDDENLIINSYTLGEFYIAIEDDTWIDYAMIVSICVIALMCVVATIITFVKRKRKKNLIRK